MDPLAIWIACRARMKQTKRKHPLGEVRLTQLLPRLSSIGDFTEVQLSGRKSHAVTDIDRRNLTVPTKIACLCSANVDVPIIEKEMVMKRTCSNRTLARQASTSAVSLALGALFIGGSMSAAAAPPEGLKFDMAVSAAAASCLPNAQGHVKVRQAGANQRMQVSVNGLPPNTEFAFFVLQVPTAPFAMSWYQGDIVTDDYGSGSQQFFGIFSSELFVFAPATRAAPQTDPGVDALTNPATAPVHTYHLGLWFSDAADAVAAGCPGTVTPFEGNHQAGIQVLNTSNFGTEAAAGPLGQF